MNKKMKHGIITVTSLTAFILAILFLPIIPIGGSPGSMGGGGFTSLADTQMKFPDNQPSSLPVYKVTDYVVLYDNSGNTYSYDTPPTSKQARAWFGKMLKDKYDLPLPEGEFETEYHTHDDGTKVIIGFTQEYQYIDDMELYPTVIGIGYHNGFTNFVYHGYKLEKVGEIKIQSAQEAYEQIETGNDIGALSRNIVGDDRGTRHESHGGWPKLAYNTAVLAWYYPTTAEHDWLINGEYLIPVWEFRNEGRDNIHAYPCNINAVDGDTTIAWTPEGNQNFTPNEKFYELKDIKTRKWIQDPAHEQQNTPRRANIYADETIHASDKIQNSAQRLHIPFIS